MKVKVAKIKVSAVLAIVMTVLLAITVAASWINFSNGEKGESDVVILDPSRPDITELQAMLQKQPLNTDFTSGTGGFYLSASDLIQKKDATAEEILKRVETIVASAKSYGFQTLMMDTVFDGQVLYPSTKYDSYSVDVVHILLSAASKENIAVYLVLDPSAKKISEETTDEDGITELLTQYQPNGLLLSGYYGNADSESYAEYMAFGGGCGYENWLRSQVSGRIDRIVGAVREMTADIPVGLIADPVWRRKVNDKAGIEVDAIFEAYDDGYADLKQMMLDQTVDFVCVKNISSLTDSKLSFSTVLNWWNTVATEADMPLYLIQAGEKACTTQEGWSGVDQLARQLSTALKAPSYYGSFFSGYDRIVADPQGSTTALMKVIAHEYKEENLFTDLTIAEPKKLSFTTYENTIVFRGKYDPQFEVTINGTKVIPTKEGEFYEKYELKVGTNSFTIRHKGQEKRYSVVRKVKVFQSVSPTGKIEVDGGVELQVEAMAYRGSQVIATFNKKTIVLTETDGDESNRNSAYTRFVGKFTVPAATDKDQVIGAIFFKATYSNSTESRTGGTVTVLKKLTVPVWTPNSGGDGTTVLEPIEPKLQIKVNTPYLEVYNPADTVTYPCPAYTSLPAGTVDYVVAERTLTYEGVTKTFYYLHSGKRVAVSDVQLITDGTYHGNNAISAVSFADEGNQTVLKVKQKWNAPFNITFGDLGYYAGSGESNFWVKDFTSDTVTITFDYATQVEQVTAELLKNTEMFTDIKWEKVIEYNVNRYRLHLKLKKAGGYYGCYAEYDAEGYLVLRFNRLPGSLQGVRIFLDPGHGGVDAYGNVIDPGAIGKYTENGRTVIVHESDANLNMVKKLAKKLEAEGAIVYYLTQEEQAEYRASKGKLAERYKAAQRWKAEIFISVHCNSNTKSSPAGTETYYTTPYSMPLAREISAEIAKSAGITNRGAKCNYFAVNRSRAFPSVLVETAFISNPNEVKLLASDAGQEKIATGIFNGIRNYLKQK